MTYNSWPTAPGEWGCVHTKTLPWKRSVDCSFSAGPLAAGGVVDRQSFLRCLKLTGLNVLVTSVHVTVRLAIMCLVIWHQHNTENYRTAHNGLCYVNYMRPPAAQSPHNAASFWHRSWFGENAAWVWMTAELGGGDLFSSSLSYIDSPDGEAGREGAERCGSILPWGFCAAGGLGEAQDWGLGLMTGLSWHGLVAGPFFTSRGEHGKSTGPHWYCRGEAGRSGVEETQRKTIRGDRSI